MKVLVVGNGAREHALAWKLAQSPRVDTIYTAPGNPGTASLGENLPLKLQDIERFADAAEEHQIDLTIIGPEAPLEQGIVDIFEERGLPIFGPNSRAAKLETSKVWAKEVIQAAGAPTAPAQAFSDEKQAQAAVLEMKPPIVIKANGLAAGKGVVVAGSHQAAQAATHSMLFAGTLGKAGRQILLEEFLTGQEVSLLAITDGQTTTPLLPACDYKRAFDNDAGPNTGGMGAYTPVPAMSNAMVDEVMNTIIEPVLAELRSRGIVYRGVLYAGLMLTESGPKVLEFNCRFGDPETQVVLPLMKSDLASLLMAAAQGQLADVDTVEWDDGACVGVVLASGGYPGEFTRRHPIRGLDELPEGVIPFHGGTHIARSGRVVTLGGRVLTLVGKGTDIADARQKAYAAADNVAFTNVHYRKDIAAREITTGK